MSQVIKGLTPNRARTVLSEFMSESTAEGMLSLAMDEGVSWFASDDTGPLVVIVSWESGAFEVEVSS